MGDSSWGALSIVEVEAVDRSSLDGAENLSSILKVAAAALRLPLAAWLKMLLVMRAPFDIFRFRPLSMTSTGASHSALKRVRKFLLPFDLPLGFPD